MFGANVRISPESELGKELAKWDKPYKFQPFPRMLYRARRRPDGVVRCIEVEDKFFSKGDGPEITGAAEQWSGANTKTVHNEDELLKALGTGWVEGGPGKAVEAFNERENAVAKEAAHRAHDDRNMSDAAKAEIKAAEDGSFDHVAEVPETPIRRRGRKPGSKNRPKPAVSSEA
jgi:hypothetical protein